MIVRVEPDRGWVGMFVLCLWRVQPVAYQRQRAAGTSHQSWDEWICRYVHICCGYFLLHTCVQTKDSGHSCQSWSKQVLGTRAVLITCTWNQCILPCMDAWMHGCMRMWWWAAHRPPIKEWCIGKTDRKVRQPFIHSFIQSLGMQACHALLAMSSMHSHSHLYPFLLAFSSIARVIAGLSFALAFEWMNIFVFVPWIFAEPLTNGVFMHPSRVRVPDMPIYKVTKAIRGISNTPHSRTFVYASAL